MHTAPVTTDGKGEKKEAFRKLWIWEATLSGAWGLLLALCSAISPSGAGVRTVLMSCQELNQVGCMQGKCLIALALIVDFCLQIFFWGGEWSPTCLVVGLVLVLARGHTP